MLVVLNRWLLFVNILKRMVVGSWVIVPGVLGFGESGLSILLRKKLAIIVRYLDHLPFEQTVA